MPAIAFRSDETFFTILNPQRDFAEETHCVVVRRDPLLGDTSVHNPFLKDKAAAFFGKNDPLLIRDLANDSAASCIFCGDRLEKNATKYPAGLVPEGRIRTGEAVLFPNLFSVGQYHAVVVLGASHFLRLSEYAPGLIENGLKAGRQFLKALFPVDPALRFVTINANYLFPAGASLVHPHLQVLATSMAYTYHGRVNSACRAYFQEQGTAYHVDLAGEEKRRGERYVAQTGRWHWITAFSPRGSNEVTAVHEVESDFERMTDADLSGLAQGISKVLACYESLGHLSFNYSLFAVRQPEAGEGHRCFLSVISRQNLYPNYRNDDYFLQKMLQTELIIRTPEELATVLRGYFSS